MAESAAMVDLDFKRKPESEMTRAAEEFLAIQKKRRSVRHFSDENIPLAVIRTCIETAAQAPSGANKQPWSFVLVTDTALKKKIRIGAEKEEREFYESRASERWLNDLKPFDTNAKKECLEQAPALIVVFAQRHGKNRTDQHYYVNESVGIASGLLLAALHNAGLATLTYTPSPMKFLHEILHRPENERAYLLIPVGYPIKNCTVPAIRRKKLEEYLIEI